MAHPREVYAKLSIGHPMLSESDRNAVVSGISFGRSVANASGGSDCSRSSLCPDFSFLERYFNRKVKYYMQSVQNILEFREKSSAALGGD